MEPTEEDVAMMVAAGFSKEDARKEAWLAANGGDCRVIGEDGIERPAETFEEFLARLAALPD